MWNTPYAWCYEALFSYSRYVPYKGSHSKKIRIRLKRNAFDFQSFGIAEIFNETESRWNEAASIPPPELCCLQVTYVGKATPEDFKQDEEGLLKEVKIILE